MQQEKCELCEGREAANTDMKRLVHQMSNELMAMMDAKIDVNSRRLNDAIISMTRLVRALRDVLQQQEGRELYGTPPSGVPAMLEEPFDTLHG